VAHLLADIRVLSAQVDDRYLKRSGVRHWF
jgi:hypothetical protein